MLPRRVGTDINSGSLPCLRLGEHEIETDTQRAHFAVLNSSDHGEFDSSGSLTIAGAVYAGRLAGTKRVLVVADVEFRFRCFHNFNLSVLWKAIRPPHQLLVFTRGDDDFRGIVISILLYFISDVYMIVEDNADVDTALGGPAAECAGPDRERPGTCAAEKKDEVSVLFPRRKRQGVSYCSASVTNAAGFLLNVNGD